MTHDANDRRPGRDDDSAESGLPEPAQGDAEQPKPSSDDAGVDSTPSHDPAAPGEAPDGPPIEGKPTPGHRTPTGRPEEGPPIVARPLTGTTPKATNDRPQVPSGSGSAPTAPQQVGQGGRDSATETAGPQTGPDTPRAPQSEARSPFSRPETPEASESAAPKSEAPESAAPEPEAPESAAPEPEAPEPTASASDPTSSEPVGADPGSPPQTPDGADVETRRVAHAATSRWSLRRLRDATTAENGADGERTPLGGRNVIALTIAGVAVVAIIALVVSTALWWVNRDTEVAGTDGPDLNAAPGPVLSAAQMLSPAMAKEIDPSRTWTETLDQAGVDDSSPAIACIGPLAADQPIPEITQLRGLSGSGDDRTAALHRADAYATPEEAEEVFSFRSAELGSCTDTPFYVENGLDVSGIGDEALGVRVVLLDTTSEYHSVLMVRTGRVVNLLDVVRAEEPVDMAAQVTALGRAINHQCGPAIGLCTAPTTSVRVGVPPAGGEQPGFLTSGDIPRVTPGSGTWRGNPPASQIDIQDGSGCEAVDLASVGGTAVSRQQRTYLLRNDAAAPPQFGIDQVVLDMESADAATELADRITDNIRECGTRTLTSEMVKDAPLSTPGAGGVAVRGTWFVVESQVDEAQAQLYRVGVLTAGDRFIYLRSNPTATFDFTDEAWIAVNLRAGERVTQAL